MISTSFVQDYHTYNCVTEYISFSLDKIIYVKWLKIITILIK